MGKNETGPSAKRKHLLSQEAIAAHAGTNAKT